MALTSGGAVPTMPAVSGERLLAAAMLVILAPVLLVTGLAVVLSGPGEVLVRAPVLDRHGRVTYRTGFRTVQQFEAARYDESLRLRRPWITPVGSVLTLLGVARLPALLDVVAGRLALGEVWAR